MSLNGTWANGTTNTFANMNVGPSGWANITVFAYNASGTGTLSAGSVSDSVQAPTASTSCTCGDICANETGWWRDGGALNASGTPLQAAVDNAGSGETICVAAGSYSENVDIATSNLTLRGEGAGVVTVTAASSLDHVFEVTADYVNISGFTATGATESNKAGILLYSADHCNISENNCSNNYDGIYLDSSSNNTLASNNASSNNDSGIYLDSSSNNTLDGNNANSNNYDGIILLFYSSDNTLLNNTASNNDNGISLLFNSSDNTLTSNNANSNNHDGISLYKSSGNTLTSNNCSNNYHGIYLYDSSSNTLASNTANLNNYHGIYLYDSSNNTLASNTMSGNWYNFGVSGSSLSEYTQNIDTSNTVDGKPIYYWVDQKDRQIPSDAGFVGVVNGTNITVRDLTLTNNGDGVLFAYTKNSRIENVTASSNRDNGIYLYDSSGNTLASNNASSNYRYGIRLDNSSNNALANNNCSNNNYGILLSKSSGNTLASNNANSNLYGIWLHYSSGNTLTSNTANSNYHGIRLYDSSSNTLASNTADSNTQWDIYIEDSDSTFANNTLNGTTVSFTYGGDVSLKGVGSPAADPAGQQTIGKFINATNQSADAWLFLNFSYSDDDVTGLTESDMKVWKHNGTAWLKDGWNGTRYLDTTGNVVGVNITSFSVFAPAAPTMAGSYVPPDPTNLANTTGSYWVNYTWSVGTSNVTDGYNVSLNGTWANGTTNTFA
ncbi:MAG: right-handed parallel beta-helix repeat-containing protein, partial [Methanosarcinales archaeon]|nr:right-handed parallel beta-helix repeat-containing protein [Methanosarcinales archaeon]